MKPYFVELKITAVVMAENESQAIKVCNAKKIEICQDADFKADKVLKLNSLAQLKILDSDWCGNCSAFNGDYTPLKKLLPEQ